MRFASLQPLLGLTLFALAACTGEQAVDTGVDTDTDTDTDSDTGTVGPTYFDPVAVGFEFDGAVNGTGGLVGYNIGDQEIPPAVIVTFADVEFFSASTVEAQAGHFCETFGFFVVEESTVYLPTHDNKVPWHSYEAAFSIEPASFAVDGTDGTDCASMLDPADWGANGQDLLDKFTGIRLGIGFAPMTDYLRDAWSEESLDEMGDSMFAQYIAINDLDGKWEGHDWTTGILFEIDADTNEPKADDDGLLIAQPISADATALPAGYVRSFAYWYQDFPLMDLDNLQDGAP